MLSRSDKIKRKKINKFLSFIVICVTLSILILPAFTLEKKDDDTNDLKTAFTVNYKVEPNLIIAEHVNSIRKEVIEYISEILYGEIVTYNDIAKNIAEKYGINKMSAQAVGGAVGWNPIPIIIAVVIT